MSALKKFYKKVLPDMALFFAMCTATNILSRKTVRSTLGSEVRKIFTGSRELPYERVPAVEHFADTIKKITNEKSILPKLIGIDGPPGSGSRRCLRSLTAKDSPSVTLPSAQLAREHEAVSSVPGPSFLT